MNALSSLPKDMPEAYKEVLNRIKKVKGEKTALQVLSWLFHAQRPLKMGELLEALSIKTDPPDKDLNPEYFLDPVLILNYCQGLVELDHSSQIIRFTHYTVQEFLTHNYEGMLLDPTDLAKRCLTYLTFDVFELDPCTSWKAFNQRMEPYQFADYAMRYWALYVRGKGEEDAKIVDLLLNLFKSPRKCNVIHQHWVWMYNPWEINEFWTWAPLHIIASEGLATICRCVLYRNDQRYIYSFICG